MRLPPKAIGRVKLVLKINQNRYDKEYDDLDR